MTKFFKYFQFTTIERNGFIIMFILIAFFNLALTLFKKIRPAEPIMHKVYSLEEQTIKANYAGNEFYEDRSSTNSKEFIKNKNITYFNFDPNTATPTDWEKLGLSSKQSKVIEKYKSKGGKFYNKEDLKKIYSISAKDYERLEAYIVIPNNIVKETAKFHTEPNLKFKNKSKPLNISINMADTSELKMLKGIGTVLASRIVKFRNALGGFYSLEQLKEVYGITEETFNEIIPNLHIYKSDIKKLKINHLSAQDLSKHPYISKKIAQTIVNYRLQHGEYADVNTLSQNKALDQEFLRKIEPYLEF